MSSHVGAKREQRGGTDLRSRLVRALDDGPEHARERVMKRFWITDARSNGFEVRRLPHVTAEAE